VVILNDITEMKNIDKMKSSFVAMASHEKQYLKIEYTNNLIIKLI